MLIQCDRNVWCLFESCVVNWVKKFCDDCWSTLPVISVWCWYILQNFGAYNVFIQIFILLLSGQAKLLWASSSLIFWWPLSVIILNLLKPIEILLMQYATNVLENMYRFCRHMFNDCVGLCCILKKATFGSLVKTCHSVGEKLFRQRPFFYFPFPFTKDVPPSTHFFFEVK